MMSGLKSYSAMKPSHVEWLGDVPAQWEVKRLRQIAEMLVSNIDKHTNSSEEAVRLCNYVDVYKNERITEHLSFMRASARKEEIERFRLRKGDVAITKDSESWSDIGVPALIECEAPDLVYGYHLAILRSREEALIGQYLLRTLQCRGVDTQFHVAANGVTRFGLSHNAIKSVLIPVPPIEEQAAIVRYLDWANARLERAIRAKRKIIALLNEQKQSIIYRAVTRGLNPNAALKPSGASWLGDVPRGWDVLRAKYLFREVDERSSSGSEELLSVSHLTGVTPRSQKNITMFKAESYVGHKLCRPGDLVINTMWAWMGALGTSREVGIVSPAYGVYRRHNEGVLKPLYIDSLLRTRLYIDEFTRRSTGIRSSRLRLYPEEFFKVEILVPPPTEQDAILKFIAERTESLDNSIGRIAAEVELLREYRIRLIADVVTGKLDVRAIAAGLPATVTEPEVPTELESDALDLENEELIEEAQVER